MTKQAIQIQQTLSKDKDGKEEEEEDK